MRFLLIAVLSLASWFGPMSASATQVQSPLVASAVSIWAALLVPGTELDASDPGALDNAGADLMFMSFIFGETLLPSHFDGAYSGVVEAFPPETSTPIQEVDVPQYGLGSRAISVTSDGLLFEVVMSYDQQYIYTLMAFATENSPSAMPTLIRIADQLFDPARPDYSTETMQVFLKEFAPAAEGPSETLLAGLPQRAEVPAEYQFLDEEVVIS
jgi:hypothetical protein